MARILLIIGGGVGAYKALDLIRRLKKAGHGVQAILTPAGKQFVTPLSVAALSGQTVYEDLFSLTSEVEMGHIELSRSADLIVVAPATADLIAKAAAGLCNDLATTTLLATDKPVLVAPAMNVRMWLHPATQRNVARLRGDGVRFVGPEAGEMACGEYGPGRLSEPEAIVAAIETQLNLRAGQDLLGRRAIVTAGPTFEPIDPVRGLTNRSSGKQGFAVAERLAARGADVTLIAGPVALETPAGVTRIDVETALDMHDAVFAALPADIAVCVAAVADWRVESLAARKVKKTAAGPPSLQLVENPDILKLLCSDVRRPKLVVGFAAETDDVLAHARAKRLAKGCDLLVVNDVSDGVFGAERNQVTIIGAAGEQTLSGPKLEIADRLCDLIVKDLK